LRAPDFFFSKEKKTFLLGSALNEQGGGAERQFHSKKGSCIFKHRAPTYDTIKTALFT